MSIQALLHSIAYHAASHTPLGPLAAIAYVAVAIAVTLVTMRRPSYGVCALVAIQPFAFYRDIFGTTITFPKVVLLAVILGLSARPGAFASLREPAARRLLIAALLVAAATALSIAQATYLRPAVRETLKALEYAALFATVYAAYRSDPNPRMLRAAIAGVSIAVTLLALSQELLGAPSGLYLNGHPAPRIAGPLEGPIQLAGYLDISLPLLFALAIEEATPALLIALFLAVCTDVLTFSRAGAIGALAGTLTIALVYRRNLGAPLLAMLGGLAVGGTVASLWAYSTHASPLLRGGVRTHANSLYIQSLVEGGIPLLAATLYMVWSSIASFARERAAAPLVAGAFAASIALALHQIVDYLIFYPKVGGWWFVVLALGAAELARTARTHA
ncbi:MAG: O-antigen ligase family protein [Vulcanimicrobiaceae bacterium]